METLLQLFQGADLAPAFLMLLIGVLSGLVVGVVPGVGTIFVLTILMPIANDMSLYAALGLIIGVTSVSGTSDTLPSVLLGVPGSAAGIATVEDGHPMARQGHAGRALGASYSASLIGGIFGSIVLLMLLPALRPIVLSMRSPDFLAVSVAGMLFVGIVSGRSFGKGVIAATLGVLISLVGVDPVDGQDRFTFGQIYLIEGISLAVLFIGLFGVVELADLLRRGSVLDSKQAAPLSGVLQGVRDTLREWRLVISSSSIGVLLGAVPGIGVTTIDWVAYGFAKRDRRGGPEFGKGNVRGVIAPESANNAKEGGNLIPTLAIGIPGSVGMSFLIASLSYHGVPPGPQLLTTHVSLVYMIVLFVVLANSIGTLACLFMTGSFARLAFVPANLIIAAVVPIIVLGALREHLSAFDIILLMLAAGLGVLMKANGWPRPAFALGFVLGPSIERYFFLTMQTSTLDVLLRPSVLLVLLAGAIAIVMMLRGGFAKRQSLFFKPDAAGDFGMLLAVCALAAYAVWESIGRGMEVALFPTLAASLILLLAVPSLFRFHFGKLMTIDWHEVWPFARILLLIAGFSLAVLLLGVHLAIAVFVIMMLPRSTPRDGLRIVLFAGVAIAINQFLFSFLQHVSWPEPLLARLLGL